MHAIQNIKSNISSQADRHSPWFGLLTINTPSLDRTDASLLLWGVVSRQYRHHGGSETTVALIWTERGNYDIGLNRTYQIVAEPTSKEMGADRPATSKTGANRQGNVHEYFIYFSMAKCCISGFCRTSVPHLANIIILSCRESTSTGLPIHALPSLTVPWRYIHMHDRKTNKQVR